MVFVILICGEGRWFNQYHGGGRKRRPPGMPGSFGGPGTGPLANRLFMVVLAVFHGGRNLGAVLVWHYLLFLRQLLWAKGGLGRVLWVGPGRFDLRPGLGACKFSAGIVARFFIPGPNAQGDGRGCACAPAIFC